MECNGWMDGKEMRWSENDWMNEMVNEVGEMRWNKEERVIYIFFFGKCEVPGDPDFHLRFSA